MANESQKLKAKPIIRLICEGYTGEGAGRKLGISAPTVTSRLIRVGTSVKGVRKLIKSGLDEDGVIDSLFPPPPLAESPTNGDFHSWLRLAADSFENAAKYLRAASDDTEGNTMKAEDGI